MKPISFQHGLALALDANWKGRIKAASAACLAYKKAIAEQGPGLPPATSLKAQIMRDKQISRTGSGGTAFQHLQGRFVEPESTEHRDHADEPNLRMPAFLSPQCSRSSWRWAIITGGLALEYAKLHVKHFVFVHFFSGYRRTRDLHAILEEQQLPEPCTSSPLTFAFNDKVET